MKTLILILLTCIGYIVTAQQVEARYSYPEWEVYKNKPKGEKHQVNVYTKTKKGKLLEETFMFNHNGQVERELYFKRNGNIAKHVTKEFNDSGKVTNSRIIVKDKLKHKYVSSYLNYTLISSSTVYNKDTIVPKRTYKHDYYSNNKYKSYACYNTKNQQTFRYEYDYYDNGSRKETRYFVKDKLKNTWLYACDVKGELSTSNTVKICKNRTYESDSSFTDVYENTVKGKVKRSIIKSAADGRVLENTVFNAKGKLLSKSVYQYNENNKLVKHVSYKHNSNHPKYIELYEYDSDNSLLSCLKVDGDGDVKYRHEYSYN